MNNIINNIIMNTNNIIIGATYRHYKGNLYKVIALAKHTETEEELVIYTDGEHTWARPKSMWNEIVNNQKRFELSTGEQKWRTIK